MLVIYNPFILPADCLLISVGEILDLPQLTLDKSQIGCYISHNSRLIDVMVLSD